MDDDAEQTQKVTGHAPSAFDEDKTHVVPRTVRPTTPEPERDPAEDTTLQVPRTAPVPPPQQHPVPGSQPQQRPVSGPQPQQRPAPSPQHQPPQPPIQQPYGTAGAAPGHAPQPGPQMPWPPNQAAPYGPPPGTQPPYTTSPPPGYNTPYAFNDQPPYTNASPGPYHPARPSPNPQSQTPGDTGNSMLGKGSSFISRLIYRGINGELIRQPWFQKTRQESPDTFVYVGFGVGLLLAIVLGQLPGASGTIAAFAVWVALAYVFFAVGTKKAVQFVAYGICGVGAVLYGLGALLGFTGWMSLSSASPLLQGTGLGTIIILQTVLSAVACAVLVFAGLAVHRTIKNLSGQ
jgi:hypothetical protein